MSEQEFSGAGTNPGGKKLGRFELLRKLGRGGMGVVYLAQDTLLDVPVAIKVLNPQLAGGEAFDRFRREVLLARRVTHPGVCRLFDIHHEDGAFFISMEYIEGPTLHQVIRDSGMLPPAVAGALCRATCKAMAAAHADEVVHRDLKPGNIIVRGPDRVSVLDFGLSKALNQKGLTEVGFQVGTVHYMSPEVIRGQSATAQSDIYSLGVILYECVTGRLPFDGASVVDLQGLIVAGRAMPAMRFAPALPSAVDLIIRRAMALRAEDRFTSCAEMDQALGQALGDDEDARGAISPGSALAKLPSQKTSLYESREDLADDFHGATEPGDLGVADLLATETHIPSPLPAAPPPTPRPAVRAPAAAAPAALTHSRRTVPVLAALGGAAAGVAALLLMVLWMRGGGGSGNPADPIAPQPIDPAAGGGAQLVVPADAGSGALAPVAATPDAGAGPGRDPVDAASEVSSPSSPAARSPKPGLTSQRGARARAAALWRQTRSAQARKGLLRTDLPALAQAHRDYRSLRASGRHEDAARAAQRALRAIADTRVDRAFVEAKLLRFNQRFDQVGTRRGEDAILELSEQIMLALDRNDFARANRLLNQAFGMLGKN